MKGLEKQFIKKNWSKNEKKNQSQNAACEQRTTSKKVNFCPNTIFYLYFKFRAKNFTQKTTSFFAPFPVSG